MKNKLFILIFPLLALLACEPTTSGNGGQTTDPVTNPPSENLSAADLMIYPGKNAGKITAKSDEADLIRLYGQKNVIRKEIGVGEGEVVAGTVIFPEDTEKELIVIWESNKPYKAIDYLKVEQPNTLWTTDQKITIGTTLNQLAEVNGKDFNFYGFEWDYAGLCKDWQGGKINEKLSVFLEAENPEVLFPDLIGKGLFPASHPKADSAKLKVIALHVEL